MSISNIAGKMIGEKRRWRAYKARTKVLPGSYRGAIDALERYIMYFGPSDGIVAATMFEDLAYLFERAAADGTPIRDIVGENPVDFAETFLDSYGKGSWVTKERERLVVAIERVEHDEGPRP